MTQHQQYSSLALKRPSGASSWSCMAGLAASFIGADVESIEALRLEGSLSSLCLHHNSLESTNGLQRLTNLRDLNLSCNRIRSVGSLDTLVLLSSLNLGDNLLREPGNLATAPSLEILQLQHNRICTLEGFSQPVWLKSKVSSLDLRGNYFSVKELRHLSGLTRLKHLRLEQGAGTDASQGGQSLQISQDVQEAAAALLPQLEMLDGKLLPRKSLITGLHEWQTRQMMPLERLKSPKRAREAVSKPQVLIRVIDPLVLRDTCLQHPAAIKPRLKLVPQLAERLVSTDSGAQTDPDLHAGLEAENERLRRRLELLTREAQQRAAETDRASSILDLARREADLKVANIRLQAGAALKAARVETAGARNDCQRASQEVFLLKEQLQERKSAEAAIKAEADARISDLKKHAESQLAELQGALLCSSHEKEALLRQLHDCSAEAQGERARWKEEQAELTSEHAKREASLQVELTNTQKDLSAACTASEDFQQQIEGLQRQFAGLRQENCQASEHVHELKAIRVDLKAELRKRDEAAEKLRMEHEGARAEWLLKERAYNQRLQDADDACEDHREHAVAAADKLRSTVEECEAELQALQRERLQSARECSKLHKAMAAAAGIIKAKEQTIADMTHVAQRQKGRLASVQAERADLTARLAAHHPVQVSRLQAEVGQLRASLASLSACKERADMAQQCCRRLESELTEARRVSEAAISESTAAVSAAEKRSAAAEQACADRIRAAAEAHNAERSRLARESSSSQLAMQRLQEELHAAKDAIRVKAVMVDSANDSVASLKASLKGAETDRAECRKRLAEMQHALREREEDEAQRLDDLELQLEQKDGALSLAKANVNDAQKRADEADSKCRAVQANIKEKEDVVRYVTEEVDRLKTLFAEKEDRLNLERDRATRDASAARAECSRLQEQAAALERKLEGLTPELELERQRAAEATQQAEKHRVEATTAAARLAQVEGNTRQLLVNLERQKSASSATIRRLASVVQELQGMEIGPHRV